jgi:peptidyl-prolyl cis-trans isomerase D
MSAVFSLGRPDGSPVYGSEISGSGVTIIALDAVEEGVVDRSSDEYRQVREFLATINGQLEYGAYQQYLRNRADVERL